MSTSNGSSISWRSGWGQGYFANGALTTSDDGTTVNVYTYDYDRYLTAFDTTGTDNDATYVYDAGKRRIAKTVDSTTTKYFLDGANVIADFDGDNVLQATYVTPGLDDNVSLATGGSTYYYMKDGLGSIRNLIDSNEATQNTYDYYAFGKELGSWTENVTNRYTYTAREYDEESEQYYYRARYYDGSKRFNRRDPVEPYGYVYCRNNPTASKDPTGLISVRLVVEYQPSRTPSLFTGAALSNASTVFSGCWSTLKKDKVSMQFVRRSATTFGYWGFGEQPCNTYRMGLRESYTGKGNGSGGGWQANLNWTNIRNDWSLDTAFVLDVMVGNYIAHELGYECLAKGLGGIAAGPLNVENSPLTIPLHSTVGTFTTKTCTKMKKRLGVQ
jgi:RHS repeat-associated protein